MTDLLQTVFSTGYTPRKLSAGRMKTFRGPHADRGGSLPTSDLERTDYTQVYKSKTIVWSINEQAKSSPQKICSLQVVAILKHRR